MRVYVIIVLRGLIFFIVYFTMARDDTKFFDYLLRQAQHAVDSPRAWPWMRDTSRLLLTKKEYYHAIYMTNIACRCDPFNDDSIHLLHEAASEITKNNCLDRETARIAFITFVDMIKIRPDDSESSKHLSEIFGVYSTRLVNAGISGVVCGVMLKDRKEVSNIFTLSKFLSDIRM